MSQTLIQDLQYLLETLIAIPSPSGQEAALAVWCENFLQAHGFATRRQYLFDSGLKRFNLLAEKGPPEYPSLLLYAHLDTVPPASDWAQDPFVLQQAGDILTGLGCSDMKGGLAVILQAAAQANPQDYCLKIALGVDEEAWSAGAWALVQQESAWLKPVALVLVPEIAVDAGQITLGLGRRGCLQFDLMLSGHSQHAAVAAASDLPGLPGLASQLMLSGRVYPFFQTQAEASEGIAWLGFSSQRQGLSTPASCQLQLAYFSLPGHSSAQIADELQTYFSRLVPAAITLQPVPRPTPPPQAYTVAPEQTCVAWLQHCAVQALGHALPTAVGWSVADENILAEALSAPVLSLAPVGGRSHQAGEWVSLQSLKDLFQIYAQVLAEAGRNLLR